MASVFFAWCSNHEESLCSYPKKQKCLPALGSNSFPHRKTNVKSIGFNVLFAERKIRQFDDFPSFHG